MAEVYASLSENTQSANATRKAYLVGGGIASLASAFYLIKDGHLTPSNIHILEELKIDGGSMDGSGNAEQGYVIRGGRMFSNESYAALFDLMKQIPSLTDPNKTLMQEYDEFNSHIHTHANARLVANGHHIVDVSKMEFSAKDRLDLIKMMAQTENSLGTRRIDDCFEPSFFETNFWHMWATTFAFQPWHSAVEFKRYLHRFIHEFPRINTLAGVNRTAYNQYDSIILPVITWLKAQGVQFEMGCEVTDLDIKTTRIEKTVERIHLLRDGKPETIDVDEDDLVFVTNGSMTEASSLGSNTTAPVIKTKNDGGAWKLWEHIAKGHPEFGNPSTFDDHIDESLWESFTVTQDSPLFFELEQKFSNNTPGTGALVTFKDSNWLMSIVVAYQPHYINQPENVKVFWGYALFPNKKGNYVQKKMSECTGQEIMTELCYHLGFMDKLPEILEHSNCIPCIMPFITAQFLVRAKGDRPQVVPKDSTNLAFLGQFAEIPEDTVFTVDYSVRSAQIAVFTLLKLHKQVTPIYKGQYDPKVMVAATKTLFK
jgi:Myosin-crossreactive antigen